MPTALLMRQLFASAFRHVYITHMQEIREPLTFLHRSRIHNLNKKKNSRILTNFPKLKKLVKIRKKIR